jgi:hypothetical protein
MGEYVASARAATESPRWLHYRLVELISGEAERSRGVSRYVTTIWNGPERHQQKGFGSSPARVAQVVLTGRVR